MPENSNNLDIKKEDLSSFAQYHYGFHLTKKATARNPSLSNDKDSIVIKCHPTGEFTFFSSTADVRGSIIDFVMWQENVEAKAAVGIIFEKLQGIKKAIDSGQYKAPPKIKPVKEFDKSLSSKLFPVNEHLYLETRGINNLGHGRFKGTVLADPIFSNAIFPHLGKNGEIVGYAIKNTNFNGFSPGGDKTLWRSNQFSQDKYLVFCESAIDALSYARLLSVRDHDKMFHSRFISTEGGFSPEVQELIKEEINKMPPDATIIGAFDNDKKGHEYVEWFEKTCNDLGKTFEKDLPRVKGYDWNKVLEKMMERQKDDSQEYDIDNSNQEDMGCHI